MHFYNSCCKKTWKEIKENVTERRIDAEREKDGNQKLYPDSVKGFDLLNDRIKDSPNAEKQRAKNQSKVNCQRRFPSERNSGDQR